METGGSTSHPGAGTVLIAGTDATVRLVKPGHGDVEYEMVVIGDDGNHVVVRGPWAEPKPRDLGFAIFQPGDVFTEHYWRDRWYSVKEVRDEAGRLKGWYCDVARPVRAAPGRLISEDLYLDLWVTADGTTLRLDEDEFADSMLVRTDRAAASRALAALAELERMARDRFSALA